MYRASANSLFWDLGGPLQEETSRSVGTRLPLLSVWQKCNRNTQFSSLFTHLNVHIFIYFSQLEKHNHVSFLFPAQILMMQIPFHTATAKSNKCIYNIFYFSTNQEVLSHLDAVQYMRYNKNLAERGLSCTCSLIVPYLLLEINKSPSPLFTSIRLHNPAFLICELLRS